MNLSFKNVTLCYKSISKQFKSKLFWIKIILLSKLSRLSKYTTLWKYFTALSKFLFSQGRCCLLFCPTTRPDYGKTKTSVLWMPHCKSCTASRMSGKYSQQMIRLPFLRPGHSVRSCPGYFTLLGQRKYLHQSYEGILHLFSIHEFVC